MKSAAQKRSPRQRGHAHANAARLGRDRSGLALLEFAIVAPVMLVLSMGGFDIARALITGQEVEQAAEFAAVSAQSMAIQPDQSTGLSPLQAQAAMTTLYGNVPQVFSGLWPGKWAIAMSGVEWTTATPTVPSTPYLAWTTNLYGLAPSETITGSSNSYDTTFKRTCGTTLNQVDAVPTDSTLLQSVPTAQVTTTSTFVLVDIEYIFKPVLPITFVTGPITFYT